MISRVRHRTRRTAHKIRRPARVARDVDHVPFFTEPFSQEIREHGIIFNDQNLHGSFDPVGMRWFSTEHDNIDRTRAPDRPVMGADRYGSRT